MSDQRTATATMRWRDVARRTIDVRGVPGKRAAAGCFARLKERTGPRDQRISLQARRAQLVAIRAAGQQTPDDLSVTHPVFVANGDNDLMVASSPRRTSHGGFPGPSRQGANTIADAGSQVANRRSAPSLTTDVGNARHPRARPSTRSSPPTAMHEALTRLEQRRTHPIEGAN